MRFRRVAVGAVVLVLVAATGGCGRSGTEINEIGLVYEGGVTQEKSFRGLLGPGSTWERVGWGSTVYRYRTDQRSFINGDGEDADARPVEFVSDDEVRLAVESQLYFKLNREERVIRAFHENLGVKTSAWTDDGWVRMLHEYFAPQIERAMEAAGLKHKWRDLYGSEESRLAFERDTISNLRSFVREVVGGDYFCGPAYDPSKQAECGDFTFKVGRPRPVNGDIVAAVEAEQTASARRIAQEQENARITKELEAEREIVSLYGPDGAVVREAIRSGKVQTFVVSPDGRVTVPTERR